MITRRKFLVGTSATALLGTSATTLLASCGGSDPKAAKITTTTAKTTTGASGSLVLGAGFADGFSAPSVLIAGIPQRLPLVVFEASGTPQRGQGAESFEVTITKGGQTVTTATVNRHNTGIPTPYYPLTFTPPEVGDYEARASFSSRAMPFRVETRDTVKLVQVGDALRPVLTPTTTDARGVTPICTRSPKPCPFHTVTLTDAIAAKKPIVFVVSTPGFCQTAICGPVLELLVDMAPNKSRVTFVHAEVYVDPNKKTSGSPKTTDAVSTYGLDYEPSLYVADAGGIVRARLDFTWDRADLEAAVATVA